VKWSPWCVHTLLCLTKSINTLSTPIVVPCLPPLMSPVACQNQLLLVPSAGMTLPCCLSSHSLHGHLHQAGVTLQVQCTVTSHVCQGFIWGGGGGGGIPPPPQVSPPPPPPGFFFSKGNLVKWNKN